MLKWIHQLKNRFQVVGSLMRFFWEQRLLWMIPMVVILLALGFLLFVGMQSPLAPFIYTLF